jgi:hypothetical protein
MLAYQLFLFDLCRASKRSRHSDSKVDEVLILDKRTQYFIMFRRIFKFKKCFQGHSPKIKTILHIFDHTIKPILLYGSEIWGSFPAQKKLLKTTRY